MVFAATFPQSNLKVIFQSTPFYQNFITVPFADKLRRLMLQAGLTQELLAHACGVSQAAVAKWLAGGLPRRAAALRLAAVFQVPYESLLDSAAAAPDVEEHVRSLGLRMTAEQSTNQGDFEYLNAARLLGLRRQIADALARVTQRMTRLRDHFAEIQKLAEEFESLRLAISSPYPAMETPQLKVAEAPEEPADDGLPRRGRVNYQGRPETQTALERRARA